MSNVAKALMDGFQDFVDIPMKAMKKKGGRRAALVAGLQDLFEDSSVVTETEGLPVNLEPAPELIALIGENPGMLGFTAAEVDLATEEYNGEGGVLGAVISSRIQTISSLAKDRNAKQ